MNPFLLPFIRNLFPPLKYTLAISLLPVVVACSSVAPRAVENSVWDQQRVLLQGLGSWQLTGRVNVRYQDENDTPRIRWQQLNSDYTIRLWGTFNVGSTRIVGQPGGVSMEHDGEIYRANSPEELILQQLGYELPVSYLEYWIRGLPAPELNADMTFNDLNQLSLMSQDGWSISYEDPRQYGELTLPREVVVARAQDDIRLTFFGLRWTLNPEIN